MRTDDTTVRPRFKAILLNNYEARGRFFWRLKIILKSWCRIFRGSHLIGGRSTESTCLDFRRLKKTLIFQWARIEAMCGYIYLYLRHDIIVNAVVAILLKLQGVAYLEGRFKSRSYGTQDSEESNNLYCKYIKVAITRRTKL